jgi:Domain of unknown function (DUF4129)
VRALAVAIGTGAAAAALPVVLAAGASAAARARVPVEPDRETARAWAAQELSRQEYQAARPNLLVRLENWLLQQLQHLPTFTGTGSRFGLLVAVLVAVAAVVYAVQRSGGLRRQARAEGAEVFAGGILTAAEHRRAAEAAEAEQDWATAVVERFRTLTRELEERAVLVPQPGRTADEVASDAGAWLPELAARLRAAAEVFDDVRYGDRPASQASATRLRELDDDVRRARPVAEAVAVTGGLVAPS